MAAQAQAQAAPTGLIAGRVLDVTSGQPVAGVTVSMNAAAGRPPAPAPGATPAPPGPGTLPKPATVLTDSQGRFAFPSLTSGRYTLRVQHLGYAPVRGAAVNLLEGQAVTDLALQIGRHGVVTGTVRDDGGDPIVGVDVRAFNRRQLGFRPGLFPRGGAVTDDRGRFRIADLPPGEYLICACVRDFQPMDKSLLATVASTAPPGTAARQPNGIVFTFAPTFHPGRTRVADAVSVAIGVAEERVGIDITMHPVVARQVSGQLIGGGPGAGATYKLLMFAEDDDPSAIGFAEIAPVSVTPDGAFDFAGVTPGRYTIEAYPSDSKKGLWASVAVTVDDRDVKDVALPLGDGTTVRGRVEFSGAAARPDADTLEKARVRLVPIVLTPAILISMGASGSSSYSGSLSREGSFTIESVPPGRYLVSAGGFGPAWPMVEAIATGDGRSLQPVLDVVPAGVSALVVSMSDVAMATLEVTLALRKYELSNELRVAIFPVDPTFWSETYLAPGRFTLNFANTTGLVSFTAVPPGDYYVVELSPAEGLMSPERMAEWAKHATTVRLRAGEKTTIALKR